MTNKASVFRFADVEVREREFSLTRAGEVLPVEPKAFRVLLILLRNPQKLIPKTLQSDALKVYDPEKQRWSTLVTKDGVEFPAFSTDSQFLYYLLLGGDQAVYRVRVTGGEPERVVDLKDWHMAGHFSFWMGLDPTDAPLLLRDSGTSDLYALTLEEK